MIRPAKSMDAFALVALLSDLHAETVYNGLVLDAAYARKMFAQFAQRHGGTHDGATCLFVYETDGRLDGFIAGMLDRVYHVGEQLWASDVYINVRKGLSPKVMLSLIGAYTDWADNNSNVEEIRLSSSYATEDGKRMEAIYERLGFEECGKVYRRPGRKLERRAVA